MPRSTHASLDPRPYGPFGPRDGSVRQDPPLGSVSDRKMPVSLSARRPILRAAASSRPCDSRGAGEITADRTQGCRELAHLVRGRARARRVPVAGRACVGGRIGELSRSMLVYGWLLPSRSAAPCAPTRAGSSAPSTRRRGALRECVDSEGSSRLRRLIGAAAMRRAIPMTQRFESAFRTLGRTYARFACRLRWRARGHSADGSDDDRAGDPSLVPVPR